MSIRLLLFCLLSLSVVPTAGAQSNGKYAVLVGVGDSVAPAVAPLYGQSNDIDAMRSVLVGKYGFPPENVRRLLNRDATREKIFDAWEWLIASAKPGDVVVFYFSGHGVLLPKNTPGARPGEKDGAICPYGATKRDQLVRGWEIGKRIDRLRTDAVTVIMDACHSGKSSRSLFSARRKSVSASTFGTAAAPTSVGTAPKDIRFTAGRGAAAKGPVERYIGASRSDQEAREDIFLPFPLGVAAQDAERAATMGALTYYLVSELRADTQNRLTYAQIVDRVRASLKQKYGGDAQEPVVTGPGTDSLPFLGAKPTGDVGRVATARVVAAIGSTVTLEAIGAETLTPGSLLLGSGNNKAWVETGRAAVANRADAPLVRVTTVRGLTASGVLLRGSTGGAGSTLFEIAHGQDDSRLRVAVGGANPDSVSDILKGLNFVQVVGKGSGADVELEAGNGTVKPYRTAGVVALAPVAPSALPALLSRLQAAQLLSDLSNPATDALPVTITANGASGYATTRVGAAVTLRVTAERAAYITVVDIAADGTITGVADKRVTAGEAWEIPTTVTPPTGLDVVKVIAAEKPLGIDVPGTAAEARARNTDPAALAREIVAAIRKSLNQQSARLESIGTTAPDNALATGSEWGHAELTLQIK